MTILKDFDNSTDLASGVPDYVIKVYDEIEARAYKELEENHDSLLRFTARFCGDFTFEAADLEELGLEKPAGRYMRLSNLLKEFERGPHVMDCKVGCRSFSEAEVSKQTLRQDLFRRLVEIDPDAPTPEERAAGACTKHRWMSFNDSVTSLGPLSFRIDGIAHSRGEGQVPKAEMRNARTLTQAAECIVKHFLPEQPLPDTGEAPATATRRLRLGVAGAILRELRELRRVARQSDFVKTHEFVGTSLLFVADAHGPSSGVFLIDFAKISPLPEGQHVDHISPWELGNHEDGLFLGIDNMIRCWEEILVLLGQDEPEDVEPW